MLHGRGSTIAGAVACVRERGMRLLLFTGRAGVGRTAVASAVAEGLAHETLVVSAAGAATEREVVVRLARALGVTHAGRRIERSVAERLADHPTAVVVDDADDWAVAGPVVDRLLAVCPELVVLVTCRAAPAGVGPRSVVHLHPLAVPTADGSAAEELRENPAVQLFVERAQRAAPAFRPNEQDVRAIAELCRRLDGLPLAVSLAASRISLLQPEAILRARLDPWELVGLSLDDELARSAAQLDDPARRVLAALGPFVGDAPIDALHAVGGLDSPAETVAALDRLVELDLVSIDGARGRCSLSSAAAAHVRGSPGLGGVPADELERRHAEHFASYAREDIERRRDPGLAIDHGNRLAAFEWLRRTGHHDRALRLLVDVAADFDRRGDPDAGRLALASALARASGDDPRTEAEAHLWIARFVAESPDPADRRLGVEHQLTARARAEASGHEPTILAVLLAICESHTLLGSHHLAREAVADGLARTGAGRHPVAEVGFLTWQAVLVHQRGDGPGAAAAVADAISKAVALGDRRLIVRSCLVLLGLPPEVRAGVTTESPSPRTLVEMARADGDVRGAGWILALVTGNALDDGDLASAAAGARDLLAHSKDRANAPLGRLALLATVRIAAATGAGELAARLVGALDEHGAAVEGSVAPHSFASYRSAVARVEAMLGDRYRPLHDQGRTSAWEDLLGEAEAFLLDVVDGGTTSPGGAALEQRLTPRELDVVRQLVRGQTNKEIAVALGMRPKTVMHHCSSIYRKLGVAGRAGAVAVAIREGLRP